MSSPTHGGKGPSRRELDELRTTARMLRREVGELKDLLRTADNGNAYLQNLLDKPVAFVTDTNHLTCKGVLRWFDRYHLGLELQAVGDQTYSGTEVVMYAKSSIQCIWGEGQVDGE